MTSRQQSIDFILDHYERPHHHGRLDHADLVLEGGNPGCGDVVKVYLKLDGADRVVDIAFEGEGCTISQAGVSVITDLALGKTLAEITELSQDEVIDTLGREVVATRLRCATLGLNILKSAEKQRRNGKAKP